MTTPTTEYATDKLAKIEVPAFDDGSGNASVVKPGHGLPVTSGGYQSVPTITRPNDTTPYAAGDVVGGAVEFTTIGAATGDIIITSVALRVNVSSVPSGMSTYRLHLYSATPPSAYADNAAWDLPAGDLDTYLGYIDIGAPVDVGSCLRVQMDGVNKQFRMGATTSLFGYLVTNGAYTPTAQATKTIRINAVGV